MLGILLTVACLAAPPDKEAAAAPPAAVAVDEVQATLRRVAQLPAAQQRDWLRHLEQRFNWASQITMKADEAHKEELRIEKLLRQPNIAWADMLELLHQTDRREKNAVAKLVRQYRKAVYNRYQTQPRTMQERQEAWYRVWSAWEAAGSPANQQDRLLDWLADAIRTTSRETIDRLPADPKFGLGTEGTPAPPQLAVVGKPQLKPPTPPPTEDRQGAEDVVDRPLMLWRLQSPLDDRFADHLAVATPPAVEIEPIAPRRVTGDADIAAATSISKITVRLPDPSLVVSPRPIAEIAFAENTTLARHDSGVRISIETPQTQTVVDSVVPEVHDLAQVDASLGARDMPQLPGRAATMGAKVESTSAVGPVLPAAARASDRASPSTEDEPRRLPQVEHVVASLPKSLLESSLPPSTSAQTVPENANPTSGTSAEAATDQRTHAEVNVEELTSRIAGINLSLRTLEGELSVKKTWSVDQLDALVQRLDILILRQKDLALFRDLISAPQRARAGAIDSPKDAITALATHVSEMRVHFQTAAPAADDSQREGILRQLESLADRLTGLSSDGP